MTSSADLLNALPDAFIVLDDDWTFLELNAQAEAVFGRKRADLLGRRLVEEFPEAQESPLIQRLALAVAEGRVTEYEELSPLSGEWYEVRGRPLPIGLAVTFRNITGRKKSELDLRRTEHRLRLMVQSIHDHSIILLDAEGIIIEWNPGAERLQGYTAEEAIGQPVAMLYTEEDVDSGRDRRLRRQAAERGHGEDEGWRVRKDGSRFWANVILTALRNEEASLTGFASITRDFTERHRQEEENRRRAELGQLLHFASKVSNEATIVEEAYERVLERVCEFAGCAVGAVYVPSPGQKAVLEADEIWHSPDPARFAPFRETLKGIKSGPGEGLPGIVYATAEPLRISDVTVDRRDFRRAEAAHAAGLTAAMAVPVRAGSEVAAVLEFFWENAADADEALLATLMEMAVQLGRVVERTRAERAIRAANQAKSDFLSRMSHELRTPLNAIIGFGQLLEMDALTPDQKESVEQILRGGRHLLALINDVLDIARVEAGKLALSPESVQTSEVLDDALALLRPFARERHIHLPADTPADSRVYVHADRQRLKQVMLNLLSNAIKYNHDGGSVGITCEPTGEGFVRIEVSDTGPGISPEKRDRLFNAFDRLGAEQGEVEGTGLGLTLSKALIEAMEGAIGVESEVGHGSTFWIEIPTGEDRLIRHEQDGALDPEIPILATGSRRLLLYIEDNLSNLKLVQRILAYRPEIELLPAMQGSLGLELARKHLPDLILLDLNLPDLTGEEVLLRLRAEPATRSIPVLVVSADATAGKIERLLQSGALDYLTKPFAVRRFLDLVDHALSGEQAESEP